MSTVLFTTCHLEGVDPVGNNRLERMKRYLDYYLSIKNELGFDQIIMTDNCSPLEMLLELDANVFDERFNVLFKSERPIKIYRYETKLGKIGDIPIHDYPFVWQGLYFAINLLRTQDKVLRIDSDTFILSKRLANYLRDEAKGFEVMHLEYNNEGAADEISVLTQEAISQLNEFCSVPFMTHHGKFFEKTIPITKECTEFTGYRYGLLTPAPEQNPRMDWYGAARLTTKLEFNHDRT